MSGTEGKDYVVTPERIVDTDLERVVYGPGAKVPMADAVKYGLVTGKAAKAEPVKRQKGKRKPTEDRARKLKEDR